MLVASKTVSAFILLLALLQVALADIYTQLQFIKIKSPKNGDTLRAGQSVTISYIMQPLVYKHTSMGFARILDINFHKRTGDKKGDMVTTVYDKCPVQAEQDKFVTYSRDWTVPNIQPGSYAFDFVELVQYRKTQITSKETVNVHVVD